MSFFNRNKKQSIPTFESSEQALAYAQQITIDADLKKNRWNLIVKLAFVGYLSLTSYLMFSGNLLNVPDNTSDEDHLAVVNIYGEIGRGGGVDGYSTVEALQKAFEAEHSVGVVLNADSPGGSPVQSDLIYEEILRLKKEHPEKPVSMVVSDICASGCYYIASAVDKIYANPNSIIGSIGVKMDSWGFTGLMDKLGVERRNLSAGQFKNAFDPFSPIDHFASNHIQEKVLNVTHKRFIEVVKKGRGERLSKDEDLFNGLVWVGDEALHRGLIDGYSDLYTLARETTKTNLIHNYTIRPSGLKALFEGTAASAAKALVENTISASRAVLANTDYPSRAEY